MVINILGFGHEARGGDGGSGMVFLRKERWVGVGPMLVDRGARVWAFL